MPFLRKAFGVESQVGFVLSQFAYRLSRDSNLDELEKIDLDMTWYLWDWVAEFHMHEGKISIDRLSEIYRLIGRIPEDPKYMFQKDDEEVGAQAERLYGEIQAIFRPHLSVAFLPESFTSNIWPLTGKPIKRVEVTEGYGDALSMQLLEVFKKYSFQHVKSIEMAFLAFLMAGTFIDILKITNSMDRKDRLSRRACAWELLPLFPCFLLARYAL